MSEESTGPIVEADPVQPDKQPAQLQSEEVSPESSSERVPLG